MNYPALGSIEGVNIRPTRIEDLDQLVSWMNDAEIQKTFVEKPRTFSVDGQTTQVQRMEAMPTPRAILYSIFFKDQLIGRLKLSKINWEQKIAHTSILIEPNPEFRGKGYGTESFKLLIDLAKDLGLKTLISKIHEENIPSIKLHEKVGFKKDLKGKYILSL